MWKALKRWRYWLLGGIAFVTVTAYGWSYNQWRQKVAYVHTQNIMAKGAGILYDKGVQFYPDPDRWFYFPAIEVFKGFQAVRYYVSPKGAYNPYDPFAIKLSFEEDQSEPGYITIRDL